MIRIAPSFKSHKSILSLIKRAASFKNAIPHSSQKDLVNLKSFLLQHAHSSSILREALHRLKEIEPRVLPSPCSSTKEASNDLSSINIEKILSTVDPKVLTPSPRRKKKRSNLAFVIASTLASNATSEKVFRPKRRPCKEPPTQKAFPSLKKVLLCL